MECLALFQFQDQSDGPNVSRMSAPSTHLHIFELEKSIRVVTDVRQIDLTKLEESGKLLGNYLFNKFQYSNKFIIGITFVIIRYK
jgi:hypothetical protein